MKHKISFPGISCPDCRFEIRRKLDQERALAEKKAIVAAATSGATRHPFAVDDRQREACSPDVDSPS